MTSQYHIRKLSPEEISGFCSQMTMVLSAGISTYEGVSSLLETETDPGTKEILQAIFNELESGLSFADALRASNAFPKYVLNMIYIGEQTGKLEAVLKSMAVYCDREAAFRSAIRYAVTYPIFMITMMLMVIFILIVKVVPLFHAIYEDLGAGLDGPGYFVLQFSLAISQFLPQLIVALVVIILIAICFFRSKVGKNFLLKRETQMHIATSRFANCLALALSSGLDTDEALDLSLELVDNPFMQEKIQSIKTAISKGTNFDRALLQADIFTGIYKSMILIGYKTGSMDVVMEKIAEEYEEISDQRIARSIARLEPTLVIVLSCIIGLLLLAFLLPLLGIMTNIG